MATLTLQKIIEDGLAPAYAAADALGDTFQNDSSGRRFVHIKNNSAASVTVSAAPARSTTEVQGFGEVTKGTISVAIPAGADRMIGPFPHIAFKNPDIQYSDVTSVVVAALHI